MPKVAVRGQEMSASPIRRLVPFANAAKAKGTHVFHLNIGQPDLPTPKVALEAVRKIEREVLEYSPSAGLQSTRDKMAEYYNRFDIKVTADDVMITTGGSEALQFAFMTTLDEGDELIIPEPTYANYATLAGLTGAVIKPLPCSIKNGFALPPIEELEALITPKTKGILICNPNNPTGYVYTQEEMEQIGEIVKKHDLFLFSDEVYREFCYTEQPHFSAFHLKGIEENLILIDSVSKRYNECGIRIGCMVTKNEVFKENAMKLAQARLSPPLLGQIVAEASIDTPQEYMQEMYDDYLLRRNTLIEGLNKIEGVFTNTPTGAFYTVAELPIDDADEFCKWMLTDFSYNGKTVMMAPATGFYTNHELGKKQVRMAYVLEKSELEEALVVLEKALIAYNKK